MNARFYVPGIGRFASADTIIPNPADPQTLNRYAYVNNNPIKYRDPTGHLAEGADGEGDYFLTRMLLDPDLEAEFYQDNSYKPMVVAEAIELSSTNRPPPQLGDIQQRIYNIGQLYGIVADYMEMLGLLTPFIQEEDLFATEDLFVTSIVDFIGEKSYVGYPVPGGPRMLVFGQDTLVTLADALIGYGATATAPLPALAATALFGPEAGVVAWHAWEMAIDGTSTLASLAYDWSSYHGTMPNYVNMGVYYQDSQLHIAILVYPNGMDGGSIGFGD